MNSSKRNVVVLSLTAAGAVLCGPLAGTALAIDVAPATQAVPAAVPPQAPSFMKQAGKALFESAQKQVLKGINQKMQGQQAQPAQTQPVQQTQTGVGQPIQGQPTTGLPTDPTATTVNIEPKPKQAPPCRSWINPSEKPVAVLLCIHGLGLQSNSYEFFGNEQSKRGIAVYAIDVRGFGAWINANGKAKVDFNGCLDDIKLALESIRAANPGIPIYVLGESMGGAVALRAASMYPELVDGLISSVPAGERFNQGKTSAKVFINLLTGFDLTGVGNDVVNQATKNQKLKDQWLNDPLSRLKLTPQELIQFQDFMNSNHEAAKLVKEMPVLFVQGNGDQLVKPEGTWELFNDVAAKDKSFFAVPGEHLIFEEAQTQDAGTRDQNFRVISSWLTAKVGHRTRSGNWGGANQGGGNWGGGNQGGPRGNWNRSFINNSGLERLSQMVDNSNYGPAIAELEQMRLQRPNDPNVLGLLATAYSNTGQADKASMTYRRMMRVGRSGGDQARALNSYLLGMNRGAMPGLGGMAFAPAAKGKIYAFYANWADQCKGMNDSLTRLSSLYGNKVDIARINIEDPTSDSLVDQFKVGPIPTVVFVTPSGKVGSTIIGEAAYTNYETACNSIAQPGR